MTGALSCGAAATCPMEGDCNDVTAPSSIIGDAPREDDSEAPAVDGPSQEVGEVRCPALTGGDMIVQDAIALEQLRGCSVVEGNLRLYGLAGLDLSPLANLRHVEGELTLREFNDLQALAELQTVQSLTLEHLTVASLGPLSRLMASTESASRLRIQQCNNLSDLVGLERFSVSALEVVQNANLRTLRGLSVRAEMGDVSIYENPSLTSLWSGPDSSIPGAGAYVHRARNVGIARNPTLFDMSSLTLLETSKELSLSELPELPVFSALTDVSILEIQNNQIRRSDVSIAPALAYIRKGDNSGLLLINNRGMGKFSLPSLTETTTIWIRDNADLLSVEVPGLREISDWLIATCNPQLPETTFDSVRQLVAVERLVLEGNLGSEVPCAM